MPSIRRWAANLKGYSMKKVGITQLREELAQYVRHTEMLKQPILITRNGSDVAAMVCIEEYELIKAANDKITQEEESAELRELYS